VEILWRLYPKGVYCKALLLPPTEQRESSIYSTNRMQVYSSNTIYSLVFIKGMKIQYSNILLLGKRISEFWLGLGGGSKRANRRGKKIKSGREDFGISD